MQWVKSAVDWMCNPPILFTLIFILFFVAFLWRRIFWIWTPRAALILFGLGAAFVAFGVTDPNFRAIVSKPDNVPIVGMLFLVGFFSWLSMYLGLKNDERLARSLPPEEKLESEIKILVWPDLVYTEMLCMILWSVLLIVWSIYLKAPIEEPANPAKTPNPSKAPWYFLGLQEMLVYYDPWIAGVLLPGLIIVGLMALPYIDPNKKGNGYYTFFERKWEILTFQFGFLVLWVMMIITGTFFRGPNQNFFGPFEKWDVHKVVPLSNINLSEVIWVKLLNIGLPQNWLVRESFGILIVVAYFALVPMLLGRTLFRPFFEKMGMVRFQILMFLLLCMVSLPIKMYLRWLFNMHYVVAIPEYFFNI
jgi:hypothetical protein